VTHRDAQPARPAWHRRRKVRAAAWIIALGSAATAAIGATLAAISGTCTPPAVVALLAWYVLVWMTIAALGSDDSR
jgi:fatty acid desaturase